MIDGSTWEEMMSSKPPGAVGPYRIEAVIGSGGMGRVYRAYDQRLGRRVAIKQIRPDHAGDDHARRRLRREARSIAVLDHPAIVQIFDILEIDSGDWLVMEYVDGVTLARRIADRSLDIGDVLQLAREVADGLA